MLTKEQFNAIVEEARRSGTPKGYERAVLREYLQCEILSILSSLKGSEELSLIGGTGLRLLYDLDRFSEDLDFDSHHENPLMLIEGIVTVLKQRGYRADFRVKNSGIEHGGRIVFTDILFSFGLSSHRDEVLMIKIEYTSPSPMPPTSIELLSRFGFVAQVVTEPLAVLCARKAIALVNRKRTQPRDIYDLSWFLSRRIIPDAKTLMQFGNFTPESLKTVILNLLDHTKEHIAEYENDIAPFLLMPENVQRIGLAASLVAKML